MALLFVLLASLVFMVIPDDSTVMIGFPLFAGRLHLQSWLWYVGEHIGLITLSWLVLTGAKKYKFAFTIFFAYQIADLIDFVLRDNSIWFSVGVVPVSMNTFGITIFALSVIKSYLDEP